jgi:hypothetical protein
MNKPLMTACQLPADPNAQVQVDGFDYPTTYAEMARLTVKQLWRRFTIGRSLPSAETAFYVARALPFVVQHTVPAPAPKPCGATLVTLPCISIRHLSQGTIDRLSRQEPTLPGEEVVFLLASHDNGFFLNVPACTARATYDQITEFSQIPPDLSNVFTFMQPIATHGWFMLDADGDVVPGLPVYGD